MGGSKGDHRRFAHMLGPRGLSFVTGDQAVANAKDAPCVFGNVLLMRHHNDGVALTGEFRKERQDSTLARDYKELGLDIPVEHYSTYINTLLDSNRLKLAAEPFSFTYHDSCHLKRTLDACQAPRDLLAKAGYRLEEMTECDMCCGMGGSYSLKLPELSAPILERSHDRPAGLDNPRAPRRPTEPPVGRSLRSPRETTEKPPGQ